VIRPLVAGRRTAVSCEARKVALLGAAGGIGQPLSLLLKMNKLITDLALYDIMGVAGVAADISHCNTSIRVAGFTGEAELATALKGAEVGISMQSIMQTMHSAYSHAYQGQYDSNKEDSSDVAEVVMCSMRTCP